MNVQRLQVLANYLRALDAPASFWQRLKAWFGAALPQRKPFDMYAWSCNSSACALGHACTIPEFKAAGLGLELYEADNDELDENGNRLFHGVPIFDGSGGFRAGANFFGISYSAAVWVFDPSTYEYGPVTATDVADRIDYLLAHDGEPAEERAEEEEDWFDGALENAE